MKNHLKLSITESKAKYLTWNSIRLKFVKKTSMSNPVKILDISSAAAWVAPDPSKALAILVDTSEDLQLIKKT